MQMRFKTWISVALASLAAAAFAEGNWLQEKIDAAEASGGGVVKVGAGTRVSKPFALKSNVTLQLDEGALLYASTNLADYAHMPRGQRYFIFAENATNVTIRGKGVLDGNGSAFRESRRLDGESQPQDLPIMMRFSRCRNVRLEGFTFRQGGAWGCHLRNCDGVVVRGVTCSNHASKATNDGIDIESSNVLVEDCSFDTGDDAVVFKTESDRNFPVTNVVVRNCTIASCCNGVKFGTGSYCDVRDIRIESCRLVRAAAHLGRPRNEVFPGVTNRICGIAGLALEVVDGGRLENVTIRNLTVEGYLSPIFIRLGNRRDPPAGKTSALRNILIENLKGRADGRVASSITGVPVNGLRPTGITLRNVELTFPGGGTPEDRFRPVPEMVRIGNPARLNPFYPEVTMFHPGWPDNADLSEAVLPAWAFYLRHADNVVFDNVRLLRTGADARLPIVAEDCTAFEIHQGLDGAPPHGDETVPPGFAPADFADEKVDQSLPVACRPAHRLDVDSKHNGRKWWARRLAAKRKEIAEGPGEYDLVMVGDSITHFWDRESAYWTQGYAEWQELAKKYRILNLGYGGDSTQHVLWRLQHGELDGYRAKVIALLVGTNNGTAPSETARGIAAIVKLMREKQPQAKILLQAVFPRNEFASADRARVMGINAHLRRLQLVDGRKVFWLDLAPKFLTPDGSVAPGLMCDEWNVREKCQYNLHPHRLGYMIWREALEDVLVSLSRP